jgi:electron transfer flavoprotein alpha subunit
VGLIIDAELCTGCGTCLDECAYEALELVDDIARVNDNCTMCRACLEVCPVEAISVEVGQRQKDQRTETARGVWVFAEQRGGLMPEVVGELLGQGRRLADQLQVELAAVLLGHGVAGLSEQLFAMGADTVYLADAEPLAEFNDDIYATVIARLITEHTPEIFLAGATSLGRSLIPRVATAASTGLTADCTGLAIDPEKRLLLQTRPAFGGNIMATIVCPDARPQMATVRPLVMKAAALQPGRRGKVIQVDLQPDDAARSQVLEVVRQIDEQVNLTGAEVVITGGRGLGSPEGFDLVRQLATALGGVVGATRGSVDAGWIGHAHQVGQTGRTVAPRLYIALGVHGAVQHVVGMQGSECIVAVNTDAAAPIFGVATYGIVGDLYEVVPAMLERLEEIKG